MILKVDIYLLNITHGYQIPLKNFKIISQQYNNSSRFLATAVWIFLQWNDEDVRA